MSYNSWFDHVRSWEKAKDADEKLPVLFVFYEDLKKVGKSDDTCILKSAWGPHMLCLTKCGGSITFSFFLV